MSILSLDTIGYSKELQEAGLDAAVADAIARKQLVALDDFFNEHQIATKTDLELESKKLLAEIEKVRSDLTQSIEKMRSDLSRDFEKVRSDLTQSIEKNRSDLSRSIEKSRIEKSRTDLRLQIEQVRAEIIRSNHQRLKWLLGGGIAIAALMIRGFHFFGF
ncbi:MAG: CCDC90 family protein [Desulfovibrio sp.]|nr:CCDC90 family protein [Desulfovibrio sp.]